ncbi:MAG: response regulator [Nannocystaceae bacterium]
MALPRPVVLADPDAAERSRLRGLIERAAADVDAAVSIHEATNGSLALRAIEAHRPAIYVGEILLPEISGLKLIRRLRDQWKAGQLPRFIFVTSMARESDRYWALRNGAHAYIIKPYEDELVLARLRQIFAGEPAKPDKLGLI